MIEFLAGFAVGSYVMYRRVKHYKSNYERVTAYIQLARSAENAQAVESLIERQDRQYVN